jgi:hypothetical protein
LRRIMIATAALAVLVAAGVASAATSTTFNSYGGSLTVKPKSAGSPTKPSPLGFTQILAAKSARAAYNAAPLVDIKLTMYGLKVDTKDFTATCSISFMTLHKSDAGCPKGSMVASGDVTAAVGPTNLQGATIACIPLLHVYNTGGGGLAFFFVITGAHQCAGQSTGSVPPYPATIKAGPRNTLVQDTPLPPDASTDAANLHLYGSLIHETLVWPKLTTTVKGKTVSFLSSVGCKAGKRPWSISYTATDGATKQTAVVSGSQKC